MTNASRTLLMDLETCDWYEPALQAFCCPRHVLPTIVSNSEVYGTLSTAAATVIGRGAAGADDPSEPPPLGGMPSGGYGITIDGPYPAPQVSAFGPGTHANCAAGVGLPPPAVPSFGSSALANGGPGVGLPPPAPQPQPQLSAFGSGLPPPAIPSLGSSAVANGGPGAGLPPLPPPAVPSFGSSALANGGAGVGLPPPAPPPQPQLSAFGSGLPPPAMPSFGSGALANGGAGLPPLPPPPMPSFGSGAVGGVGGASVGPAAQLPNFGSGMLPNGGSVAGAGAPPHVAPGTGSYRRIGSVAVMGPLIAAFEGVPIAGCLGDQMAAMLGGCGLGQRMWVNMSVGPDGGHARWVWVRATDVG